jgi:multidrug efflux pump subunit AcrA (membrane-fusion protein)
MEHRGSAQGSFPQPAGGDATPRAKAGTVYVLSEGGRVRSIAVRTGISDGTYTAVESDSLADGMAVIVGMNRGNENAAAQGTVNPFAPGGPRRDRR